MTGVSLRGKGLGDRGAKELAAVLEQNSTVSTLWLCGNGLGDVGAEALARMLCRNGSITSLSLAANSIGDVGAGALARMLRNNNTVAFMNLGGNAVGDKGAQILARSLIRNGTIKGLGLQANGISDRGAEALAIALYLNVGITRLDLRGNRFGDEGARALANAMHSLEGRGFAEDEMVAHAKGLLGNSDVFRLGLLEISAIGHNLAFYHWGSKNVSLSTKLEGVPRRVKRTGQPNSMRAVYEAGVRMVVQESHSVGEGAAALLLERVGMVLGVSVVYELVQSRPCLLMRSGTVDCR